MRSVWLLAVVGGCATNHFVGGTYRDSEVAFRVGQVPSAWKPFELAGADVAFHDSAGGNVMVNGLCQGVKDLSLDVLTNHALFGVDHQQLVKREVFTLDGREALLTQWTAALDGVPVALELVVLKKDDCTYDLQLVSGPGSFASSEPGFRAFVAGFAALAGSGA